MRLTNALRATALASGIMMLGCSPLLAQDNNTPPPASTQDAGPPPQGPHGGGPQAQQRMLDHMTKALNLSPDQVTQIKAIQDDSHQQAMALRNDTTTAGPDRRAKMMAIRQGEQAKVRGVLNDDQKTKYDAMLAKMKERREEHREGQAPPQPPPSV